MPALSEVLLPSLLEELLEEELLSEEESELE